MLTPQVIRGVLSALAEPVYRDFQSGLMPTVPKEKVLGVRAPRLHQLAKKMTAKERDLFLADLPHRYYDEDLLHVYLINGMRSYDRALAEVRRFLPYINNWATCDSLRPKVFAKNTEALLPFVEALLGSTALYPCRLGIGFLLSFYLGDAFHPDHLSRVAAIKSEEYDLLMMQGWYFATALALQYDATLPYYTEGRLTPEIRAFAVKKALESNRIDGETKALLRSLSS